MDQNEHQRRNWCSTKVDDLGFHESGEGNWGYCKSDCKGMTNPKIKDDILRNRTYQLKTISKYNIIQPSTDLTSRSRDAKSGKPNVLLLK